MGVYIKGMEMPKSCYACMFFAQADYWNEEDEADILSSCKRTGEETWESVSGYLPNCPLVPVQPHGRLIDADAVRNRYTYELSRTYLDDYAKGFQAGVNAVIGEITPTIIPAEEGE